MYKASLRAAVINTLIDKLNYDEILPGNKVVGYSTDMAFTPDRNLPYNRVAVVTDDGITITSEVDPTLKVEMTLGDFLAEVDRLV